MLVIFLSFLLLFHLKGQPGHVELQDSLEAEKHFEELVRGALEA